MNRIPVVDLSQVQDASSRNDLLFQLRDALFNVGFLYIRNHGVSEQTVNNLVSKLPALFDLPDDVKQSLSKLNSPHFLGYSGLAEEITLGKNDLREQFDFATELPAIWQDPSQDFPTAIGNDHRLDLSQPYWRLRGPNQWPPEHLLPGFRAAFEAYHDAVQELSYKFVHLVEEAFGITIRTFDDFFLSSSCSSSPHSRAPSAHHNGGANGSVSGGRRANMSPQHRIKLLKYPPSSGSSSSNTDNLKEESQGVGAHKDSSGWLTFLYQVPRRPAAETEEAAGKEEEEEACLQVLSPTNKWLPAPPIPGTFVVNFGKAMESATQGAVRATVHRVRAPSATSPVRYSIPFFQGLPLDMTMSEIRAFIPESVRELRQRQEKLDREGPSDKEMDSWTEVGGRDSLGRAQLRKWVKSHPDVGRKWYGDELVEVYSA
ncbi:hypothetical protein LTS18_010607 [Coniosporium uncinatum]|uniref:Uncharacterized protein n=1 Tax=Coniosporium uncinatum TaxID=93489 RepID=A0ACC3CZP6_9PEZI|nr:hypothetical protein LTS18_010607 [Coniosporium uncinatum]